MKPIALVPLLLLPIPVLAQAELDSARVVVDDVQSEIRAVTDFDGDGDPDLLVWADGATPSFHVSYWHLGRFMPGESVVLSSNSDVFVGTFFLVVGDLTGDGLPEVVLDRHDLDTRVHGVTLYPNVHGYPGAPVFVATGAFPVAAVLADRDGDGREDLGLLEWGDYPQCLVSWWSHSGPTLVSSGTARMDHISDTLGAGNVVGDDQPDLIAGSEEGPASVYVSETLASGAAGVPALLVVGGDFASSGRIPHAGDLDGDGDVDLLVSWLAPLPISESPLRVVVVENVGGSVACGAEQSFAVDPSYPLGGRGPGFLVDWDLDGDLDFLAPGSSLAVLENRGQLRFALADVVPMPKGARGLFRGGVGDLDGDGFPDVATGRAIAYGDGMLTSRWGVDDTLVERLVDLEDDGDPDFVSDVRTWINDGTGDFRAQDWRIPSPGAANGYVGFGALDDLDGDGRRDLLVGLAELIPYPGRFLGARLLRGTAGGEFAAGVPAAAPGLRVGDTYSFRLGAHDLDGDGDRDLATGGGWWENDGSGFFGAFRARWTGAPLALADVDGDHDPDLLTWTMSGPSSATTTIHLQRNLGGGAFAAEPLATESSGPNSLSDHAYFVDLDSDGDLDVAFGTSEPSPRVLLLENSGGALAAPLVLVADAVVPDTLAFDDLDGDGALDVVGLEHGQPNGTYLVWHHAVGPFTFDAPVRYFGRPASHAGDVDQDGDIDLVGWRIVRGRRFEGSAGGRMRQYGEGSPGSGGLRPLLGATGPIRPSSSTAALRIRSGVGGSLALLRFGAGPAHLGSTPLPGLVRLIRPPYLPLVALPLSGTPGAPGEGSAELSLASYTTLHAGAHFWLQAFVLDPALPGGVSSTNGLELTFGL